MCIIHNLFMGFVRDHVYIPMPICAVVKAPSIRQISDAFQIFLIVCDLRYRVVGLLRYISGRGELLIRFSSCVPSHDVSTIQAVCQNGGDTSLGLTSTECSRFCSCRRICRSVHSIRAGSLCGPVMILNREPCLALRNVVSQQKYLFHSPLDP